MLNKLNYVVDVQQYMLEGADHGGSEFWTEQIQQIIIQFFENIKK